MTNILFLYDNLLDSATVTASSTGGESTGFPVTNLQHPFRTKVWRTSTGSAKATINLGSAQKVTSVALANYNWTSTGPSTLDLEFATSSGFSTGSTALPNTIKHTESLAYSSNPTANGNKACIVKTFTSQAYQWVRLNVVSSATDWDIGRMFLGPHFAPTDNYRIDWSEDLIDPSFISVSVGGQEHVDEIEKYRALVFNIPVKTQAQWELFQKMCNDVGIRKDLFVAFDYDSEPNEMTIYGKLTQIPGMNRQYPLFELGFGFKESR